MKLRKNNWDTDTYEFDDVLTEYASQKRVYEVVAKPVVEVCYLLFPVVFKCMKYSVCFLGAWGMTCYEIPPL